ncbi:YbaB/EbfC family nucleoid-associated protein [[Actinomadura] parvosata]|uniref:YbaB/EbfC family nucleoid-associated protein n=1 Tax=[Actinomadura] parvosata TaxID=1955412 RepID=UPI00406CAC84
MSDFYPEDLERITARAEEMLVHVERLKDEIDVVVGRGEAADGQVRVTAAASGRLMDVTLAPRALRLDAQKLAEAVLRAAQEAHDHAARQVDAIMAGPGTRPDDLDDERFAGLMEAFEASMDEQLRALEERHRHAP